MLNQRNVYVHLVNENELVLWKRNREKNNENLFGEIGIVVAASKCKCKQENIVNNLAVI